MTDADAALAAAANTNPVLVEYFAPPTGKTEEDCGDDYSAEGVLLQRGGTGPAGEKVLDAGRRLQTPALYLAVHNIKSADNLGSLLRTAGAFGAREVLVVSAERTAKRLRKNLRTFGAHGAERRVSRGV